MRELFSKTAYGKTPKESPPDLAPYTTFDYFSVHGDGRSLAFADAAFDIAYSNSVIEHVGTAADQVAFAAEIRRIAPRYFVQTPNKWFFVEPHFLTIGIHLLPQELERRLVRWGTIWGLTQKPTQSQIDEVIGSIRLLDKTQMQSLFPDAEILEERFMGTTKSLIAIRR